MAARLIRGTAFAITASRLLSNKGLISAVNQSGKQGGDAQGGLALGLGLGAGSGSGSGGTGVLGIGGTGVGVGTGIGVGVGDASAAGGDASDNAYIGSITINA